MRANIWKGGVSEKEEDFAISSHFFNLPPNCLLTTKAESEATENQIAILKTLESLSQIITYNGCMH